MGERCGVYMVECVLSREVEISSGREVRSVHGGECIEEGDGDIEWERSAECVVGSGWERKVEISSG